MFETFVILFREGLEAFLVVAIMLAYLKKTGRTNLIKPVYAGIVAAFIISATTGWHVAGLAEDPLWEGTLSLVAGLMVASFTIYIMRTAKNIRQNIGETLEAKAQQTGMWAPIGVFSFTVLMIAREGMETALMLGAITAQTHATEMLMGAALGLGAVAVIAYLWASQSTKINIKLFLQVTGIFLIMFAIDLFFYGLHELSEVGAFDVFGANIAHFMHESTEIFSSKTLFKKMLTYGLLVVPAGWLLWSFVSEKLQKQHMNAAE